MHFLAESWTWEQEYPYPVQGCARDEEFSSRPRIQIQVSNSAYIVQKSDKFIKWVSSQSIYPRS